MSSYNTNLMEEQKRREENMRRIKEAKQQAKEGNASRASSASSGAVTSNSNSGQSSMNVPSAAATSAAAPDASAGVGSSLSLSQRKIEEQQRREQRLKIMKESRQSERNTSEDSSITSASELSQPDTRGTFFSDVAQRRAAKLASEHLQQPSSRSNATPLLFTPAAAHLTVSQANRTGMVLESDSDSSEDESSPTTPMRASVVTQQPEQRATAFSSALSSTEAPLLVPPPRQQPQVSRLESAAAALNQPLPLLNTSSKTASNATPAPSVVTQQPEQRATAFSRYTEASPRQPVFSPITDEAVAVPFVPRRNDSLSLFSPVISPESSSKKQSSSQDNLVSFRNITFICRKEALPSVLYANDTIKGVVLDSFLVLVDDVPVSSGTSKDKLEHIFSSKDKDVEIELFDSKSGEGKKVTLLQKPGMFSSGSSISSLSPEDLQSRLLENETVVKNLLVPRERQERQERQERPEPGTIGLGIKKNHDGNFYVEALAPGGAAAESGEINIGDMLVNIDSQEIKNRNREISYVRDLISGMAGTQIHLVLQPVSGSVNVHELELTMKKAESQNPLAQSLSEKVAAPSAATENSFIPINQQAASDASPSNLAVIAARRPSPLSAAAAAAAAASLHSPFLRSASSSPGLGSSSPLGTVLPNSPTGRDDSPDVSLSSLRPVAANNPSPPPLHGESFLPHSDSSNPLSSASADEDEDDIFNFGPVVDLEAAAATVKAQRQQPQLQKREAEAAQPSHGAYSLPNEYDYISFPTSRPNARNEALARMSSSNLSEKEQQQRYRQQQQEYLNMFPLYTTITNSNPGNLRGVAVASGQQQQQQQSTPAAVTSAAATSAREPVDQDERRRLTLEAIARRNAKKGGKRTKKRKHNHRRNKTKSALSQKKIKRYSVKAKRRNRRKSHKRA